MGRPFRVALAFRECSDARQRNRRRLSAADVEARGFGAARFGLDGVWQSGYEFTNANIWIASEFSPIARHSHEAARAHSLYAFCTPAFLLSHGDGFLRH